MVAYSLVAWRCRGLLKKGNNIFFQVSMLRRLLEAPGRGPSSCRRFAGMTPFFCGRLLKFLPESNGISSDSPTALQPSGAPKQAVA